MGSANAGNRTWVLKDFWFTGFTYNATASSRAAITGSIVNGSVFCIDPLATADLASLPTGMTLKGSGDARYALNVTKPSTDILSLVAGVLVNAPYGGYNAGSDPATSYVGGRWVTLAVAGDSVPVLFTSGVTLAYGTSFLGATDAQWYASLLALGTNGANIPSMFARPLISINPTAATTYPCSVATRMMMRHND